MLFKRPERTVGKDSVLDLVFWFNHEMYIEKMLWIMNPAYDVLELFTYVVLVI